ncbi:unnamed protein product [Macrosiphum euphorbiae]|uniref:Uncharacterized protein n=1 Tax=Macrosiphum euphorbiae TaxID=13131 RepID=A0AAV0VN40_9HEMI|nr:unnamed protein product [Macrosiphum euphorbiae]
MDTLVGDKQPSDTVETLTNDASNDEIWEIIDKEDDEDLRNLSAAVYAFILLVIGIPLWWRMTEVQRHSLPYAQISQLGTMDVIISTDIFVYTKNPYVTEQIIEQIYTTFNSTMFSISAHPSTSLIQMILHE